MELDYNQPKTECPRYDCKNKDNCKCLSYFEIPAVLGDDSEGSDVAPKNGAYCNAIVKYAANNSVYLYSSEGVPTRVEEDLWPTLEEMQEDIDTLEEGLADETEARILADQGIEEEIEHLRNNPDVVDIVATYADLVAYDTSELGDKDVIRVLTDETHDDESTYYRWDKPNQEWEFIGAVEGYYTKDQTDVLLAAKQDVLTFDSTPTANSTNPVTSGGIKTYVDEAPAFKPFPASVTTDGTTQQLMSSILALSPEVGTAYLGTVELSDMPAGLMQEEVEVYVYSDYVVYCIMRSTDVSPYAWWCASYNYQGWQPVNTDTTYTAGTNITIDANNQISATDTTYTAGNGLDLTGTEFSVDSTVVALQSDLPTNTSDLTNDGADGTSTYVEADELATVATTGDYGDLLNTPTIPVVNDATLTIQKNSTDVGTFTANASSNSTINITVPTTAADVSALPDSTKYAASISLTINSSTYVVTAQLKDQDGNNIGSSQTIDLPLESVVVSGSYDSQTKEVVLTLQGGSTIRFSVADLVSGLQSEITAQSPLDADLVDDSTSTNKFVTSADITAWNGKQNALTAGSNISISGDTISATDTTYSNFTGATSQDAGAAGLVPAPAAGDEGKFLSGNGLWTTVSQYSLPIASANDLGGIKVGTNLSIDSNTGVLSATDTTYSNFTGTDGQTAGAAGLVPAPATTDADKYLKSDGTWATVSSGQTYTAGEAIDITNNVISATNTGLPRTLTSADYNDDPSNPQCVNVSLLQEGWYRRADSTVRIYNGAYGTSPVAVNTFYVVRNQNTYKGYYGLDNGTSYPAQGGSLLLAWYGPYTATATNKAVTTSDLVDNLTSTSTMNALSAKQGKVLKDLVDGLVIKGAGAPTTSTAGTVGKLYEDTTNGKLYICTDATNPYVWEEVGTGGGGDVISAADWSALWADTIQNMNGVGV